jgi:hypothetical protein
MARVIKSLPRRAEVVTKGKGGYDFDNGVVAFGNPMDLVGKVEERRVKLSESRKKEKLGDISNRSSYH